MQKVQQHATPWFKQFWPWFLILGPGIVVLASVVTIFLAASTADTVVSDDYYKDGKSIHLDQHRDQLAEKQGWRATIMLSAARDSLRVLLQSSDQTLPAQLSLRLIHPTLADRDVALLLPHAGNGLYQGKLAMPDAEHWFVELTPPDAKDAWRLRGEWYPDQAQNMIELRPSS